MHGVCGNHSLFSFFFVLFFLFLSLGPQSAAGVQKREKRQKEKAKRDSFLQGRVQATPYLCPLDAGRIELAANLPPDQRPTVYCVGTASPFGAVRTMALKALPGVEVHRAAMAALNDVQGAVRQASIACLLALSRDFCRTV
ncbi:hypothetical protein [Duganella sp. P38]|uniref:hypothetical protein n=1 Tax=Duganella sp. P38 TaxID=3423949 RepID=UPI003D7AB2F7